MGSPFETGLMLECMHERINACMHACMSMCTNMCMILAWTERARQLVHSKPLLHQGVDVTVGCSGVLLQHRKKYHVINFN